VVLKPICYFSPSNNEGALYASSGATQCRDRRSARAAGAAYFQLTESYSQFIAPAKTNSRSSSALVLVTRPDDFWTDFQVRIFSGEQALSNSVYHGRSNYSYGERGPCILIGATLTFEFPADAFLAESASITVEPPEGEPVTADFDLGHLR